MRVHIHTTLDESKLDSASTLVFRSIRTGFPTSEIHVWFNRPRHEPKSYYLDKINDVDAEIHFTNDGHPDWIEKLIETSSEPFWLCDPDVFFHGNIEQYDALLEDCPLVGRRIPAFNCPFTGYDTMSRIHTCLMRINPTRCRKQVGVFWESQICIPDFNGHFFGDLFVKPKIFLKQKSRVQFHDTCSELSSIVGGRDFSECVSGHELDINSLFDHLNCGTYSDIIDSSGQLTTDNRMISESPEQFKGLWRKQLEYFKRRAIV